MLSEWDEYKNKITFTEVTDEMLHEPKMGDDKKDIPFIILHDTLNTNGILSDDTDIARMSKQAVSVDTVLTLRDYSRASTIDFHLRINGCRATAISIEALGTIFKAIGTLIKNLKNAPPTVHYILLGSAASILVIPSWRKKAISYLARTLKISKDLAILLLEACTKGSELTKHHQQISQRKLDELPSHIKDGLKLPS